MSEPETQFRPDPLPVPTILNALAQQGLKVRAVPPSPIRITTSRAALCRMVGQGLQARLPAIDVTLTIQLATKSRPSDWPDSLTLSGSDGAFEIEEGPRLLRILTGIDIDLPHDREDSSTVWLLSEVLGRLADTPFDACDRITRKAPSLSKESETLRLVLRSGRHLVSTHMRGDAGAFVSLLARATWSPIRQSLSIYATLPIHANVQIGSHVLSTAQLHSLAVGDILLPDSAVFSPAGEGWLPLGQVRIHVRYSGAGTLTVLDIARGASDASKAEPIGNSTGSQHKRANTTKGKKMEEHHDENEQHADDEKRTAAKIDATHDDKTAADTTELDAVGVTVHFQLGKTRMTLGDIRTLAAGSVVLFGGGSPESVAVVASGRTLGRGEVVDVDGRLGIRITQWGHESE